MCSFKIRKLSTNLGAEILDIDVKGDLTQNEKEELKTLWLEHGILLFRNQRLTPEEQIVFTRNFGELTQYTREKFNSEQDTNILVLSNITKDGKLIGSPVSGRVWHTDGHYLHEPPAGSLLYAVIVPPEGGDTLFANMAVAWNQLPEKLKNEIEYKRVIISRVQSRPYNYPERPPVTEEEKSEWQDVEHPAVRVHPDTGEKSLYLGGNVPWRLVDTPLSESLPLVTKLQEFSVMDRFVYRHQWREGDIILWDNRCVMHKATWYDGEKYQRLMHRTTIVGDVPV